MYSAGEGTGKLEKATTHLGMSSSSLYIDIDNFLRSIILPGYAIAFYSLTPEMWM